MKKLKYLVIGGLLIALLSQVVMAKTKIRCEKGGKCKGSVGIIHF